MTAATNTHFCHPSNRFYPALRQAGIVDWQLEASIGMTALQRADLIGKGIGITNLVNRATARADELAPEELVQGAVRLTRLVAETAPRVVAVAGITAFRVAFGRPRTTTGEQVEPLGDASLWVIPNPSGLNAHVTAADMAWWMKQLAVSAGLEWQSGIG